MESTPPPLYLNNQFRYFLATRFLFMLGMQMVNTALGWHLYAITGDPLSLGWLGLSEIIPALSLALYAGHVIDKSNRRKLLLKGLSFYFLAVAGLTILTYQSVEAQLLPNQLALCIYGIIFCTGIFRAFTGPSFHALLAQLVPRVQLPMAVTRSTTAFTAAMVTGPVLAGLILSWAGITVVFSIALVLLLLGLTMVYQIKNQPVMHGKPNQKAWASMKEGLSFVWRTKEVLSAMSVDMFAVLFGGVTALLPVFAMDILKVDAAGMGILRAAQGLGTVLILFILSRYPLKTKQGSIMLIAVALFGVCMLVFAVSTFFWLSFAALFFGGVTDGLSVVVRSTIIQLYVPDDMRGRVSSVNSMFINSSNELGQFESGIAARLLGPKGGVLFGASITLLVVAIAWVKAPKLRKLEY